MNSITNRGLARRAFVAKLHRSARLLLSLLALTLVAALAEGSARAEDAGGNATNDANNPLTPKITVNLQDYYTPSFYGPFNSDANSLLPRGLIPMNVGGLPQLLRFTLPYSVNPSPQGYADGLGDLTVFDLFVLPSKPVLLAVGPLFVAPTGTDRFTGAGRLQAGPLEPRLLRNPGASWADSSPISTRLLTTSAASRPACSPFNRSSSTICRKASMCDRARSGTSILKTTLATSQSVLAPVR
jgi:hypothetical protein